MRQDLRDDPGEVLPVNARGCVGQPAGDRCGTWRIELAAPDPSARADNHAQTDDLAIRHGRIEAEQRRRPDAAGKVHLSGVDEPRLHDVVLRQDGDQPLDVGPGSGTVDAQAYHGDRRKVVGRVEAHGSAQQRAEAVERAGAATDEDAPCRAEGHGERAAGRGLCRRGRRRREIEHRALPPARAEPEQDGAE